MRIGMFSESFEPIRNGVAVSVRTLVTELRARKHHVCVVAPHYPNHQDEMPFVMRVPSVLTTVNPDYPVPFPWFPRLRRRIRALRLDLLHSHSPWFLGLLAARIARQYDLPHVSTYHTLYEQYAHYMVLAPPMATVRFIRWWLPEFYNTCSSVIVPSRAAEHSLRERGVTARIEVVPTGVPLPPAAVLTRESRESARASLGVPRDAPLLLYVGRIAREKNLGFLLEAFDLVRSAHPDARLLLVGGGPYLEPLRRRAGNRTDILFAGAMRHPELHPVYAAADLFVMSSTSETQGLVVTEARAAGTPAVVVDAGGAHETVSHGEDGLVTPVDRELFAQAVCRLLGNRDELELFRAACLRRAPDFTPHAMAGRVLTVYNSVLGA